MKWYVMCGASLALSTSLVSGAFAFSADNEARQAINEVRQQMKVLTDTTQRINMQMSDRIDTLELEISRLRGMIEELGGPSYNRSSSTPEQAGSSVEQDAYEGALDMYRQGDAQGAIESFQAFLTVYPDSALAPAAKFYLGSSLYANRNYKEANTTLQNLVKANPEHPRSPDALLVLAASQYELNDRAGAKASLQKITKDYPGSEAAQTAEQRLKML
ncbi:tol-pal system protein YbgF [Orrella sp. 11846]|uniref:tol-pal system protein YbgF n=1 Tax=Orrella sp. 11846 TaxID=3409913 RepID=UPI003B5B6D96